ncbi:MAG: hypothetical protein A2504_01535 [Bdellovibrionales bacterium RIFOXYD12_FULL_39_22]|nr:MAG: hypothetical protein A2385_04060 [Bdellovibrionales bacterium RIFOXYB1_FULL_39_21]OFZ42412.1 MAG: hypothetical protein A2485_15435 [Bdellovibrionales bacterium RIFOXYC12_FULL_39_17]OFZ46287.1 MAG: hypothetical protein A2404_13580 [Bdellovibrionales bacterium RIFOXYC1_FULL_39_130]OFZ75180.1 MAG: hypothetical protein A2560_15635 [Bdellovibrionales bacterium RIFOXYD1_FULL_39_84]OFZ93174.1 MAG: hypothetical protein A2504_01535 [Bdellovibrionales bacterium RIFOXYD12_FULL_39_22]HLE11115.1 Pi
MNTRPWPIVLLACIYFVTPFFNFVTGYTNVSDEINFLPYIVASFSSLSSIISVIHMVVPGVIAGIAIYKVKNWSYPVFLAVMVWVSIRIIYNYATLPGVYSLTYILVPMTINIFFVSYILLPNVRAAYIDPRLRWWETRPRFKCTGSVMIECEESNKRVEAQLSNIAEGGLFVLSNQELKMDAPIKVSINILDLHITSKAKIVYHRKDQANGYGIQFTNISKEFAQYMRAVTRRLEQNRFEITRPKPIWTEDLYNWAITLLTTGKGITPILPPNYPKPQWQIDPRVAKMQLIIKKAVASFQETVKQLLDKFKELSKKLVTKFKAP